LDQPLIRPILIGIGASHSGSGKTFLASRILKFFSPTPNPQFLNPVLKWGALKYTKTTSAPELITDRRILMKQGKDTWQMLTSGASEVVWVRSDRQGLATVLPDAMKRLSHLDVIIVEGNSAIEFLNPDIVIFILGKGKKDWKPDMLKIAVRADIVLYDAEVQLPADVKPKMLFPRHLSENSLMGFFEALTRMVHERRAEARDAEEGV